MINKSNIGEVTIEQKDFRVTIKQKEEHDTHKLLAAPVQTAPAMPNIQHVPAHTSQAPSIQPTSATAVKSKAAEALRQVI